MGDSISCQYKVKPVFRLVKINTAALVTTNLFSTLIVFLLNILKEKHSRFNEAVELRIC
jgi:hypothetical protein